MRQPLQARSTEKEHVVGATSPYAMQSNRKSNPAAARVGRETGVRNASHCPWFFRGHLEADENGNRSMPKVMRRHPTVR